jgi:hypothetical protein
MIEEIAGAVQLSGVNADLADAIQGAQMPWVSSVEEIVSTAQMGGMDRALADVIQGSQMQLASTIEEIVEVTQLGGANVAFADAIRGSQMRWASTIEEFVEASFRAQGRISQVEYLIQAIASNHQQLATTASAPGNHQTVNVASGLRIDGIWNLVYSVLDVDRATWIWVRDNIIIPLLIAYFAAHFFGETSQVEKETAERTEEIVQMMEEDRSHTIVSTRSDVWTAPDSAGVIRDTIYKNNLVTRLEESGSWTKVEYRDRVEGKVKQGRVLAQDLKLMD